MRINLVPVKGGQGTTVVSVALAYSLGREHDNVTLEDNEDVRAICGLGQGINPVDVGGFTIHPDVNLDSLVVGENPQPTVGINLAVVRNDYLTLRRFMQNNVEVDGVIVVMEPERPLNVRDVQDVVGVPVVASFPVSPVIARAVDAGTLIMRMPKELEHPMNRIKQFITNKGA
mgnify:FL=1